MPNRDGTGPMGQGPLTGRGMGPCRGGFRRGIGLGRGFGIGRGLGLRQYAEPTKEEEKAYLEAELKSAEEDIKEIKKRLAEIK